MPLTYPGLAAHPNQIQTSQHNQILVISSKNRRKPWVKVKVFIFSVKSTQENLTNKNTLHIRLYCTMKLGPSSRSNVACHLTISPGLVMCNYQLIGPSFLLSSRVHSSLPLRVSIPEKYLIYLHVVKSI